MLYLPTVLRTFLLYSTVNCLTAVQGEPNDAKGITKEPKEPKVDPRVAKEAPKKREVEKEDAKLYTRNQNIRKS